MYMYRIRLCSGGLKYPLILHFYDQLNKEKETEQREVERCIKWVNSIETCET